MDLSIPASGLQSAIEALENGADSVYFGLSEFSARKGAENFSFEDLRRIKQYAVSHNKKIYVAFNTIVGDSDMERAYHLLKQIDFIGIDGLIVQDFGIVNLCKREFPSIPLHASTQMAVLNTEGVLALKKLGFSRVVLARELSLRQIEKIRNDVKDIELKVFIHGALCYSISGLCYASFALTNGETSANKGSCAGICRWPFMQCNNKTSSAAFSLADVESDKHIIQKLQAIGIDALKVEGRLKNSLYAKNASLYYRAILDNKSDEEIEQRRENLECAFARKTSKGYFYHSENHDELNCSDYVGHRGYKIGTFITESKVKLTSSLSLHDGLFYLDKNGKPQKCASTVKKAKSGDIITIKSANSAIDSPLYKTKKSDENEKAFNKSSYKIYMKPIDITFRIEGDKVFVNEYEFTAPIQKATKKQNLEQNLKAMFTTAEGLLSIGGLEIINHTSFDSDAIFIPLSLLKKIKNEFYEAENKKAEADFSSPYTPPQLEPIKGEIIADETTENISSITDVIPNITPAVKPTNQNTTTAIKNITSVIINNVADLLPFLNGEKQDQTNVIISPLMNIANREAVKFFRNIFASNNLTLQSSLEECGDGIKGFVEDSTSHLKDFPIFTSMANLPKEGTYTTTFKGKTYTLKVISENGLAKTYLL